MILLKILNLQNISWSLCCHCLHYIKKKGLTQCFSMPGKKKKKEERENPRLIVCLGHRAVTQTSLTTGIYPSFSIDICGNSALKQKLL